MPSPFPGMDPWLEGPSVWADLHGALLYAIREEVVRRLPRRYAAMVGQHVWLEGPDEDDRVSLGSPDMGVARLGPAPGGGAGESIVSAPVVTMLPAVRRTGHRYLRITDRDRRRLVTVVELLSPSNKDSGKNRPQYLEKRNEYLATDVNLVEIDLLRGGERMPVGTPPPTPSDYLLLVCRAAAFPQVGLWPFSVRDPIPPLVIPLDPADGDVQIALRSPLDHCYAAAEYDRTLSYHIPPVPPLARADAAWAAALLAGIPRVDNP